MKTHDLYKTVTEAVVRDLESGVPPWVRPWKDGRLQGVGMIPTNLATGRLYSGGNILVLWLAAQAFGYHNLQFCTFQQANEMGAKVRKGSRAHSVLFTKRTTKKDEEDGKDKTHTVVKTYSVFHSSQLDGVPADRLVAQAEEADPRATHDQASAFARGTGITFLHGGNRAFYNRRDDTVTLPKLAQFEDEDAYWQTLAHEATHWAGNEKRLNRKFGKRFGDAEYSFEELVAELGSAFVCARLGIPAGFRSSSYIDHWLKVLKEDSRAIFTAASYAGQAADYLWNRAFAEEQQLEAAE